MDSLVGAPMKHHPEKQKPWKQLDINTLLSSNFECMVVGQSNEGSVDFGQQQCHSSERESFFPLNFKTSWTKRKLWTEV